MKQNNRANLSSLDRRRADFFDTIEAGQLTTARGLADRMLFRLDDTRSVKRVCREFSIKPDALKRVAVEAGELDLADLI